MSNTDGMLLRDLEAGAPWIPQIPQIILDADRIPSEAFDVMTQVGGGANTHLLRSARMIDNYYWAPIPEQIEMLPNSERVPLAHDPRFPY